MSQNCVQDMKQSTNVTELCVGYEGVSNVTELCVGYRSLLHVLQNFVQDMKESTNATELRVILGDYLMSYTHCVQDMKSLLMSQNCV